MKPILYYAAGLPGYCAICGGIKTLGVDYEASGGNIFHSEFETMVALA